MIEFKDIVRKPKTNQYFYGNQLAFELVPHSKYPEMYYYFIEGEGFSEDFFNKTRAAANARRTYMDLNNRKQGYM